LKTYRSFDCFIGIRNICTWKNITTQHLLVRHLRKLSILSLATTITVLSLTPFSAKAQILKSYGLKLGINSSMISNNLQYRSPRLKNKWGIGFNTALFMEWFNNPVISLLTQVEYSQNNFIEKLIPLTSDAPSEDVKATWYSWYWSNNF